MTCKETRRALPRIVAWSLTLACIAGCQHLINPYVDDTIPADGITTATAKTIERPEKETEPKKAAATQSLRENWPQLTARGNRGTVTHWALWYEDPLEDVGVYDSRFAWTWQDYVAWPYSTGRWIVNALALPVSVIVTPPFAILSSDGIISDQKWWMKRDAQLGPGEPEDVGEASSLTISPTREEDAVPPEEDYPTYDYNAESSETQQGT